MTEMEENILENKDLYYHQYLQAIFQIHLQDDSDSTQVENSDCKSHDVMMTTNNDNNNSENQLRIMCVIVSTSEPFLSFVNYTHFVFETLMEQDLKEVKRFIDQRFFPERSSLFSNDFRVYDNYTNKFAYLFDCYCRFEYVKDFANLVPMDEQKKIKQYIIEQAALLLVMPYMNVRYSEDPSSVTPFDDLFEVITLNKSWPSDYLNYVKKFFVEITDAIHNAKIGEMEKDQDESTNSLSGVRPEELNLEQVIKPLYSKFCAKFKKSHVLSTLFIDDIKCVNILIASPILAEIFVNLNSPPSLYRQSIGGSESESSTNQSVNVSRSSVAPSANNNNNNPFRQFMSSLNFFENRDDRNTSEESFFQHCLLGILLCNSPLPSVFSPYKNNTNPLGFLMNNQEYEYAFFQSPSAKNPSMLEKIELEIDDDLQKLRSKLTDLFYSLLKNTRSKIKTLKWIECFLTNFNNRSKLWSNEFFHLVASNPSNSSDGLVLNLSAVLLTLCKPFCTNTEGKTFDLYPDYSVNVKMLLVDPLYMKYCKNGKYSSQSGYDRYLKILRQEAVLVSQEFHSSVNNNDGGNSDCKIGDDYEPNFITRIFFMTHKALHIGFRVIHERFTAINQENSQLQRRLDSFGASNPNRNDISSQQRETLNRLDANMTITLSMKSALTETNFINLLLEFYLATACWINNLAACENEEQAAKEFKKFEYDQTKTDYFKCQSSRCLRWVPEFIIENIIDFLLFLRYFEIRPKTLNLKSSLEPFLVMIIFFIGSPNRMRNPHLRAKMAEMLEALLPNVQTNIPSHHLDSLFSKPYFIEELFPALLKGFVSIEISDEANNADVVAFEQKFNYRRPMYVVFKYLCIKPQHKHQKKLIQLAKFAEENVDNVQSPLFLRFINLLINDAIYLLDEGLGFMARLRELQQQRESEGYQSLSSVARQQNEANFVHLGRMAKFHNFIGRETIVTLAVITSYVKTFFSHKILVDRMASMLNYFLLNLVGPNKRNFKVKQMNDYEFIPGILVKKICRIYVNLACNNIVSIDDTLVDIQNFCNPKYEEFCLAIGRDDRSYSPDLLIQAEDILSNKLSEPMLGQDMLMVDRSVKELIKRHKNSEIPIDDIPDEFLDPLMNTLISDPVILPNSHKVLDRATITRHLLSDHTDPYTRTPLTMDMLIPDLELKQKIEDFIKAKLKEMNKE